MKIYTPQLIEADDKVKIQTKFEYSEGIKTLWYTIDKKYAKYLTTEKSDAFVVGLLLLAMQKNEDIYVVGKMSEKLYYNLNNYYIKLLSLSLSYLNEIKIHAESLDNGTSYECKNAVSTGFSGGVDSFSTIYEHLQDHTPENYKITHFLFNNVGSHDEYNLERAQRLFHERYELLKNYPEEVGKDFIKVDSNLSEILNMKFIHTHTIRNFTCVLLLQKLFSKYYYSSTFRFDETKVEHTCYQKTDMAYCDAIAQKYLSTETLSFIATGLQYDRVEKTDLISSYEPTYRYLNTCVEDGKNCSACFKCCRTIFTLELLNKLDKYKKMYDISAFNKKRTIYLAKIIVDREDTFNREILKLAKRKGYKFPFYLYILAMVLGTSRKIKDFGKSALYFSLNEKQYKKIKSIVKGEK